MTIAERVRHLYRRAGFGAGAGEVERWSTAGLDAAVGHLLTVPEEPEAIIAPEMGREPFDPTKLLDVQAYWLHRMVTTQVPLVEKMTLFWHGHFATGVRKSSPERMQRQNDLIRRHALGSFPALLREIGKDAAMLLWLDGHGSTKKAPNENYAREVMELFTTGPGIYTEADIQEAARAFTGWRVDRLTGTVTFQPRQHDGGIKQLLGRSGTFGADEIADILSGLPETGRFLAGRLWRFFASQVPHEGTIAQMAAAYTASGGQISPMLRLLFSADAFYDPAVIGALIRSPAELAAGTHRLLGLPVRRETAGACIRMGQSLYDPPNVAGWPGGAAWLGASSLLTRWNWGEGVRVQLGQKPSPQWQVDAATPEGLVDAWLDRLCVPPVSTATRQALITLASQAGGRLPADSRLRWELTRTVIRTIIASPEYQTA